MLIFKKLKWKNWFSYGNELNEIDFTENRVTQIVGKVGAGKSSIPLILQEICYSKNSKGIKKTNLKNRNSQGDVYAELYFTKDDDEYVIIVTRKSTVKISLFKNGYDISEHTAPNTIKLIENIFGLDFNLFSQLQYQSSKTSLEFLTATDTNRKKFLISLFSLDKYVQIFEGYKVAIKGIENEISIIDGKISTILNFIQKNSDIELIEYELEQIPELPKDLERRKEEIIKEISTVDSKNILIKKNL